MKNPVITNWSERYLWFNLADLVKAELTANPLELVIYASPSEYFFQWKQLLEFKNQEVFNEAKRWLIERKLLKTRLIDPRKLP